MFFQGKDYIRPSKKLRLLSVVQALTENERLSQTQLARFSRTSSAMVNQYLAELHREGMVQFAPVNRKSFAYRLTDKGQEARRHMMEQYCAEMVRGFASIKELVRRRLEPLAEGRAPDAPPCPAPLHLALFGAAETGEVVLAALEGTPFAVTLVVDNDTAKHGTPFHGHTVQPPAALLAAPGQLAVDAVVVASFAHQRTIQQQLLAMPGMPESAREVVVLL
ncbi:winged helix-turn-helix transcriptional regulator [Nitratidesulfovibrio sp. SRB-5]|uniref:winged helix-turn-helix transcriptional regulator n=1 Tax=Nitratidesulfovibrio sp. SRB-5 TaxID=2872636 RepID=UPI001024AB64|nr:winged helix-turn-helix transcriptional regulator [Nitratidesulfovibrio sp. SRB-5]MBZ2172010.1 winged helix-turn-helix transcriptional regulator [Nitratidesulfovibrio sp. SRB-5]RXF77521.1 winged helix-turn-helix transcriptional regulator [Desulfovibrio sp. DS-1]